MSTIPSTRWEASALEVIEKLSPEKKEELSSVLREIDGQQLRRWIISQCGKDAELILRETRELILRKDTSDAESRIRAVTQSLIEQGNKGTVLAHGIAEEILRNYNIVTREADDTILVYEDGIYVPAKQLISRLSQTALRSMTANRTVQEVFGHVRRMTYKTSTELQQPRNLLCLENGILSLSTMQLQLHTPEMFFTSKIPVTYLPEAECPAIKKFLSEIVLPEDQLVLEEIAGYCLLPDYPIHRFFILVGNGRNGKSTFINLLRSFLGEQNCTDVSLQQLETNRFASARLEGKKACFFADTPAKALQTTGTIKSLTGGDSLGCEKKFKEGFSFKNEAKIIVSANTIPLTNDDTDAFYSRATIINFPNQFLAGKADKWLLRQLTTPIELSGFFNLAIQGLRRLLDTGDFSNQQSLERAREEYIKRSDTVHAFVLDCVEVLPNEFVPKRELYAKYAEYCRENSYSAISEAVFHKRLLQHVRVEDFKTAKNGIRMPCWKGICVKPVNPVNPFSHLMLGNHVSKEIEKKVDTPDILTFETVLSQLTTTPRKYEEILAPFQIAGYSDVQLQQCLDKLRTQGDAFEPSAGYWARTA